MEPQQTYQYICYNRRTEEFLVMGTARECAKFLGYTSTESFRRVLYRYRKTGKGRYMIVRVEDGNDEE